MSGFVDDTQNFFTLFKKNHTNSLEFCKLLQYAIQSREHLLCSSGSKLNPSKYVFYIIQLSFDSNSVSNIDY